MNNLPPPPPFVFNPQLQPPLPLPPQMDYYFDGNGNPVPRGSSRRGRTRGHIRVSAPRDPTKSGGQVLEHDFDASSPDTSSTDSTSDKNDDNDDNDGDHDAQANGTGTNKSSPSSPPQPEGSVLEVKRVDEVYDRKSSEWILRDSITSHRKKRSNADKYAPYAFLVHRKFNPTPDPTLHIITTTLDIKSKWIQKVGEQVIGQVQGITWTAKPLRIDPKVFLAWLPELTQHQEKLADLPNPTEDEKLTLSHLSHLTNYLTTSPDHAETLSTLNALLEHDEITFEFLWAILKPRTILYTRCATTTCPRTVRLVHADICTRGQAQYWRIDAEYVEFNSDCEPDVDADTGPLADDSSPIIVTPGTPRFGLATLPNLEIPSFKGATKISALPIYPVKYYRGWDQLKTRLIERGRKWMALQGPGRAYHRHYNATGYHYKDMKFVKLNTNSRIMVDWKTFQQTLPNYEFPNVTKTLTGEDIDNYQHIFESSADSEGGTNQLSEDELLLTSPIVYGFSLADKLWLEFNVDHVHTFKWNDEPFENLVLARDQKSLIKSLVEAHAASTNNGAKVGGVVFDDFVEGKGRGLVINLFGNPGVGKSLTAEATSEHVRKPLYIVGAGDLGTSASILDSNLTRIFNISANWGAVVLIDEADVFLEERSFHDLERNAMVAVFLRQLEYFTGILFLTTNRVRTFDEAFQSRIHVALRYQDLTADAKRQIWVAFLKKAHAATDPQRLPATLKNSTTSGLTSDELHELGEKKINGRQIKNVVRTACALASSRKEVVGYKHLVQVLDMMEQFETNNAMYQ